MISLMMLLALQDWVCTKERGRRPRNGDAHTLKIVAYEHLESFSAQMKAGFN